MDLTVSRTRAAQRRPLRTYSNRSAQSDCTEPVTKKRQAEGQDGQRVTSTTIASTMTTQPETKANLLQRTMQPCMKQQPRKESILSYFKIASPTSGSVSCSQLSNATVSSSTAPSSPLMVEARQRKRRRLTTRPLRDSKIPGLLADDAAEKQTQFTSSTLDKAEAALKESSIARLNRQERDEKRFNAEMRGMNRRQISKLPTVQTTLSLSVHEKGFVECKDCNVLYNPFHDKDAKYHTRRHAAMLKAKSAAGNTSR
ncbi:uncharacterized protein BCR38DRAFT_425630 [Pseudomassariella vexata]|uniref:N-acetyltransferase ESCO zinc-finger domain-containing protein n=1 Tax=Pseudomassariella vexata TaxID=1141098 RepID=A0A1Y2E659_9PEZI|nr:uncharacterized protein BCR38DRAFT_425630 [Pseudomassariella vexata]ORY67031.1 hypothetical protein BCR38DRAFT_425630 [Pseudomassariella vexata]